MKAAATDNRECQKHQRRARATASQLRRTLADLLFDQVMRGKQIRLGSGLSHSVVSTIKERRRGQDQDARVDCHGEPEKRQNGVNLECRSQERSVSIDMDRVPFRLTVACPIWIEANLTRSNVFISAWYLAWSFMTRCSISSSTFVNF
jgi:hypothetical protein